MKPVDFTIYWKETPVVQVCYDAMKQPQFTVLDHSHLPVLLFGMDGKAVPTAARLDKFFADRCFPSTRQNAKELLAIAGLTLYQPKLICRKTHGIVAHDHYWIRYADGSIISSFIEAVAKFSDYDISLDQRFLDSIRDDEVLLYEAS